MTFSRRSVLRTAAAASVAALPMSQVLAQPKAEFTYKYANNASPDVVSLAWTGAMLITDLLNHELASF